MGEHCYNKFKLLRDFIEKEWECKNLYEVPVITKIVLSRGFSINKSKIVDLKSLNSNINDFRMIICLVGKRWTFDLRTEVEAALYKRDFHVSQVSPIFRISRLS